MSEEIQVSPSAARPRWAAHTPNDAGEWHPLGAHLRGVEALARQFAEAFDAAELAAWAALLHDLGKYRPEFQRYLDDCYRAARGRHPRPPAGSVPHKQLGALCARRIGADLLAFPILGHHGGMPGLGEVQRILAEADPSLDAALEAAARDGLELRQPPDLRPRLLALGREPHQVELLLRMLFSCLVDADALDTLQPSSGMVED